MEDDALVLHSRELGESDLLLSLYCRQTGRITAIAKGARRSKKRFVNKLEIFSYLAIDFTAKPTNPIAFLHEAELYTSFPALRTKYPAYLAASVIQELLLTGIREGERDSNMFRLSLWALHYLERVEQRKKVIALFLLRYLDLLGYKPELGHCRKCRQPLTAERKYTIHPQDGALHCSDCEKTRQCTITPGTIRMLNTAQDMPLERLIRLKPTSESVIETLHALHACCHSVLQRELHSWQDFLSSCR